jgi:hypothetical protein
VSKHRANVPFPVQDQIVYDHMVEHLAYMKDYLKQRKQGTLNLGVFHQTQGKDIKAIKKHLEAFKLVRDYYKGA